ncbi:site-specific integrase [Microbacterium sp. CJ77]|uniref:site-specific integrase n=1 Tax=Microbacterium sp. CJ77 TaxID=2079201 RepID=UPI000CD93EB3|nr:site-specific integrase [Microbacterium sp. CJ77]
MGSVHPYKTKEGKRYLVRYRKPDGTNAAKRGFRTKREAEEYIATVSVSISANQYVDPGDARITIADLGADWLQDQAAVIKPSSLHPLESAWRVHVQPRWGAVQVGAIRHSDVRSWVTALTKDRGATTVIRCYGILASILDIAVRDRRIAENPSRGIRLPKKRGKRHIYLSHTQVGILAHCSIHPELVLFLAYTGLRWGEASGLRVKDVDLIRRRVHVHENAVMVNGTVHTGTPKSHVTRSVPYPDFLENIVRAAVFGKGREALLFGDGQSHLRLPNSQDGWFAGAVRRAATQDPDFPRVTPHDLRHTAASLAISAGANVKAVQRMLGHASAAMTLDTYADLFDDDLDNVAEALSRARQATITLLEVTQPTPPNQIMPSSTAHVFLPLNGGGLSR